MIFKKLFNKPAFDVYKVIDASKLNSAFYAVTDLLQDRAKEGDLMLCRKGQEHNLDYSHFIALQKRPLDIQGINQLQITVASENMGCLEKIGHVSHGDGKRLLSNKVVNTNKIQPV